IICAERPKYELEPHPCDHSRLDRKNCKRHRDRQGRQLVPMRQKKRQVQPRYDEEECRGRNQDLCEWKEVASREGLKVEHAFTSELLTRLNSSRFLAELFQKTKRRASFFLSARAMGTPASKDTITKLRAS